MTGSMYDALIMAIERLAKGYAKLDANKDIKEAYWYHCYRLLNFAMQCVFNDSKFDSNSELEEQVRLELAKIHEETYKIVKQLKEQSNENNDNSNNS